MPDVKCSECWRDVTERTDHCPGCGAPLGGETIPRGWLHLGMALLLGFFLLLGGLLFKVLFD